MEDELLRPQREKRKTGWFERMGVRYFDRLSREIPDQWDGNIASDEAMARRLQRYSWQSIGLGFLYGAVSALGSVLIHLRFEEYFTWDPTADGFWLYWSWFGGVTLVLTAIEFILLFEVSLRLVHRIAHVTGHHSRQIDPVYRPDTFSHLLARAALEIPDPVMQFLEVDPTAHLSKWRLILVGAIYKSKVMVSNVLARLVLTRLAGKSLLKLGVSAYYISVPVTGFWNAWVVRKVARQARLRLYGNLVASHLAEDMRTFMQQHTLSEDIKLACFRAVASMVVLTQNYHPNLMLLLVRLSEVLGAPDQSKLDNWQAFLETHRSAKPHEQALLNNLLVLASGMDGYISPGQRRQLPQAFGKHTRYYLGRIQGLKRALVGGRYRLALSFADLDHRPDEATD